MSAPAEGPGTPALAQLAFPEQSLESMVEQILAIALTAVSGCDGAGLTVSDDGHGNRFTGGQGVASTLEPAQYELGEGPCVLCLRSGAPQQFDAGTDEQRWPDFAGLARAHGVASCIAVPLELSDQAIGAFNLYARNEHALDEPARQSAFALAGQAACVVGNFISYAHAMGEVERLQRLVEGPEHTVAQATGVLMARHDLDASAAHDLLEDNARRSGQGVAEAAREVVSPPS